MLTRFPESINQFKNKQLEKPIKQTNMCTDKTTNYARRNTQVYSFIIILWLFFLSNRRHKERTFFLPLRKSDRREKRSFLVSRPPPLPKPLFTSFKLPNLLKNNSNFFPYINFFNPCHFLLKVNIIERKMRRSLHHVNKIIIKPPPSPSFFFSLSFSVLFLSTLFISFLN